MTAVAFRKSFFASTLVASVVVSFALVPIFAYAQIDPTSGMLIDSSQRQSGLEGGLDSGRYTVRPKSTPRPQTQSATASATAAVVTVQPSPTATPILEEAVVVQASALPVPAPEPEPKATPEEIKKRRFDRRNSILDLSLSPVYVYTNSSSSYWFRSYNTSSPGAHLDANVWLSDKFGLHTSFMTTLGASVNDSTNNSRDVVASHNWFDIGIRFRHFASNKPKSSALILGIDWSEYRFTANPTAQMRHRLVTSGAQLKAGVEIPTSKTYMWTADVSLLPKAKHQELDTLSTVKSGTSNDTNSFGASLGGVVRIGSGSAYFWRLSQKIEKNIFDGSANTADPLSGITPNGVSVINSSTLFEIGCTWGD